MILLRKENRLILSQHGKLFEKGVKMKQYLFDFIIILNSKIQTKIYASIINLLIKYN